MVDRNGHTRSLNRALGYASLGLGLPQLASPKRVAALVGVDDAASAPTTIRLVGARELVQAAALLRGPTWTPWTRVVGDALDASTLVAAMARHHSARPRTPVAAVLARGSGERRRRTTVATAAVLTIGAADLVVAMRSRQDGQHKDRPGPLQLRASITVNRSPQEVYDYWRNFENLPSFMLHLQSVTVENGNRSHWTANAPLRKAVAWDAEMTGDEPGRRISWKSLPGADIDNSGTVHFAAAPGGRGTEVRVVLHYDMPGGRIGRVVAKLFGEEPEQQVRDDLRRFKQVLETGDIVRSEALPHGTDARHQLLSRAAHRHDQERSHR